jgi:putative phosphonate transport system ATP-binding protein
MMEADAQPLLSVTGLGKSFGTRTVLQDIAFSLWPGEVVAIVGESGSGKTTLLRCIGGQVPPDRGRILYESRGHGMVDLASLGESQRRRAVGSDLGFVHQNPRDGLRLSLSAGANIGEPLLQAGWRHYGRIRALAAEWLARVEIDSERIDEPPSQFSGGMQQRLQIARNLVTEPRLVLMDEPTGGLDVSVQARLLDLLRRLVADLDLAVLLVTHDLGVARLLADRLMVMQNGRIVESGLTDQVLDDPHQPYSQLLVASVLQL